MSLLHLLKLVLLLLLFELPAHAMPLKVSQLLADGEQPVTVVCLGDSITGVYYHTGSLRAYPEMLEIALRRACPQAKVTVRNAGVSGDTTRGALARLERDVIACEPQLVTVMLGMNDMVRVPLSEFKKNLGVIIARCRKSGAEVLLCTQDSVMETAARPEQKLAEFTQAIRDVGREESVEVVDCFARFEAVRANSVFEWGMLHSDEIHPNMDGHKIFASAIARTITGKDVSLADEAPPQPAIRHTLACLKAGKAVKVLAMPPYDRLMAPALEKLYPGAAIMVESWPVEGLSLAEIRKTAAKVRTLGVDLVVLAIPASAGAPSPEEFHQHYAWTMNLSLSFGPQQWDVVAALPTLAKPQLTPDEQRSEALARRLIKAQDLSMISRQDGDGTATSDVLLKWLETQLGRTTR